MPIEISRENGNLIVKGGGDIASVTEAIRAFVTVELSHLPACLKPDAISPNCKLTWHPGYTRSAWPDKDHLEIIEVWRSNMLGKNVVVLYRCEDSGCPRCRNPEMPLSCHLKMIRDDGFDAVGAGLDVEVRRGKKRETITILVDQPVFMLVGDP